MNEIGQRIYIIDDCRSDPVFSATGKYGTYEGLEAKTDYACPSAKIRLDDGTIIWGCECWWKTANLDQGEDLEDEQQKLHERIKAGWLKL